MVAHKNVGAELLLAHSKLDFHILEFKLVNRETSLLELLLDGLSICYRGCALKEVFLDLFKAFDVDPLGHAEILRNHWVHIRALQDTVSLIHKLLRKMLKNEVCICEHELNEHQKLLDGRYKPLTSYINFLEHLILVNYLEALLTILNVFY